MAKTFIYIFVLFFTVGLTTNASAQQVTCKRWVEGAVKFQVKNALQRFIQNNPQYQNAKQSEVVDAAGRSLVLETSQEDRFFGYLTLMFYGDKKGRDYVAEFGGSLETPEQRAYFYLALGLNLARSQTRNAALKGRDYIRQMRDTGFIKLEDLESRGLWKNTLKECALPK